MRQSPTDNRPKSPEPKFHQVDLRNSEELETVFKQYQGEGGIWGVVHLAALKAVGESAEKPLDYYHVNVGGSITLLKVGHIKWWKQI